MNLTSLEYVIEAERCGSISQAAKNLFIAQPNLSKAIRDLENEFDIVIFKRTPKGISTTIEGQQFIKKAKKILNDINDLKSGKTDIQSDNVYLNIIGPQSAYISAAFSDFIRFRGDEPIGLIRFKESNSTKVIDKILSSEYDMGVIRYEKKIEDIFLSVLNSNNLKYEEIFEFKKTLLISADSPLAACGSISRSDLKDCIEVVAGDSHTSNDSHPDITLDNIKCFEQNDKIYLNERSSQLDLLSTVKNSYMWSDPVPETFLKRYGLVNAECSLPSIYMKDVLIYKSEHIKTIHEDKFTEILKDIARKLK